MSKRADDDHLAVEVAQLPLGRGSSTNGRYCAVASLATRVPSGESSWRVAAVYDMGSTLGRATVGRPFRGSRQPRPRCAGGFPQTLLRRRRPGCPRAGTRGRRCRRRRERSAAVGCRLARRQPHEVAVRLRDVPALLTQGSLHLVAAVGRGRRPARGSSSSWSSAARAARWAGSVTESGIASRVRHPGCSLADRVADPEAGEAVRLREGAQHDEVRVADRAGHCR